MIFTQDEITAIIAGLDEPCPSCRQGNGEPLIVQNNRCAVCHVSSYTPTESGRVMVEFIRRHKEQLRSAAELNTSSSVIAGACLATRVVTAAPTPSTPTRRLIAQRWPESQGWLRLSARLWLSPKCAEVYERTRIREE
jgi:hypothetical protein